MSNTTETKAKPTPGPAKVRFFRPDDPESDFFVEAPNTLMPELGYGIEVLMDDYGDHNGYPREQRLADANLLADAINVHHETGLTPRQLVEQKKQLREVLEMVKKTIDVFGNPNANWSTKMIYESIEGLLKATE